jgi:hypothetical protein
MRLVCAVVAVTAWSCVAAPAQEFRLENVASAAAIAPPRIAPRTVLFSDHRNGELVDPATGLIRFSDWGRARPDQRAALALYPGYDEPTLVPANGIGKARKVRLHMYVAEARFLLSRTLASADLARYATLDFIERVDPAIKSRVIAASDVLAGKDAPSAANRNPLRGWCEGAAPMLCIQSRYKLEGRLPIGISLLNKIRDSEKKIADTIDFQSELRVLAAADIDEAALKRLTGLEDQVTSVFEQTIFHVNQIMQFGRFVAVFQRHPSDPGKTIATVFIALAVESDMFEKKKEYEKVPVLRNLVPAQVLAGNSSFNTGNSISSGLPNYARNRIRAVAEILERGGVPTAARK